jgi:hypothetical protein
VQKDGEEGLRLGVQAQKKLIRLGVKIVGLLLFEEEEGRRRRRSI